MSHLPIKVWLILTTNRDTGRKILKAPQIQSVSSWGLEPTLCVNLQKFPITFRMKPRLVNLFGCLCVWKIPQLKCKSKWVLGHNRRLQMFAE